jgi:hypothetical protein
MSCGVCHVSCCALCGTFYVATCDLDYRMRRVDTAWQRLLLESSNPAKYSEHIVVHLPRDTVFDNNVSMGFFVARLLARSFSLAADGLNRDWAHPRCLWRPFSPSVGRCPHGTGRSAARSWLLARSRPPPARPRARMRARSLWRACQPRVGVHSHARRLQAAAAAARRRGGERALRLERPRRRVLLCR